MLVGSAHNNCSSNSRSSTRSFGNQRSHAGLSFLAVIGGVIACGVVVLLFTASDHDKAVQSRSLPGRLLSEVTPQRFKKDKASKRRLTAPSSTDSPDAEHSGSHDGASHEGAEGEHHSKGYLCLFFLLTTIAWGCLLQVVQERVLTFLPYTCMLFFTGIGVAVFHWLRNSLKFGWAELDNWHASVDMWEGIDPHLIFYIFLPALIFAEAMKLKIKLFGRLLGQVLILAGPGVLMGTALTGAFAKKVLPYGWDWKVSFIFGSILAATDPVAVVALFNTLGVSQRLTMLVSGESLINDGTAIVIFTILLPQISEPDVEKLGVWDLPLPIVRLTIFALLVGALIAVAFLFIIFLTASSGYHSDAMIQVAVTICCAFLSFFLAETELSTSGVLCVVSSGLVFAYAAWPRFTSRETIHTVWEFIEFVGNTLIFTLAGLLFGDKCVRYLYENMGSAETKLEWIDFFWLIVVYFGATVIRALMIMFLLPLLNCVGQRITLKEALVIVWSGLRGAVGLVLAIIVDLELNANSEKQRQGAKILFHVGGMAMLTVGINAPLTKPLLGWLGLTKPPEWEKEFTVHFEKELDQRTSARLHQFSQRPWFHGAHHEFVSELVPQLASDHEGKHPDIRQRIGEALTSMKGARSSRREAENHEKNLLARYREVFMRAVEHQHWEAIEGGVVNRSSKVARLLLYSTESCLDDSEEPLSDWDVCQGMLEGTFTYPILGAMWHTLCPRCYLLEHLFPSPSSLLLWKVYASLSYIKAHVEVREKLQEDVMLNAQVQEKVHQESIAQQNKATQFLDKLPIEAIDHGKARMLAGKLLHMQSEDVRELNRDGYLSDKGASHILHVIHASQRDNEAFLYDIEDEVDNNEDEEEDEEIMAPLTR